MKLHELGAQRPSELVAKTLRTHMGHQLDFSRLSEAQAQHMLARTRKLLGEWKSSPSRHFAERNPDYLRLIMVEQGLINVLEQMPAGTTAPGVSVDPAKQAAMSAAQQQQKKRDIQDQIKIKQKEIQDLQKAMNSPVVAETKTLRKLREASELQQAQVVLAAQDMVDQIQKMMEQISAMQFKDLPALTDAIKNDVGVEQAQQFSQQAAGALTTLLANVQESKTQLEQAQGILTGQAPTVPGTGDGNMPAGDIEPTADVSADLSLDANLPAPEDEEEPAGAETLGRERR